MGALARHRYLVKARRFRRNQAEARARDALAEALRTKPRFWACGSCFAWHADGNADCVTSNTFTSGHLNHRYGASGWDQVPAPHEP